MAAPQETYVNSVQRQGYSGARLQPANFGAAGETLGRAVAGLGQDVSTGIQNINEIKHRDAETAAQEADNMRLAQRMKYYYEGDNGYFNRTGKDAVIAAQQLPEDIRKIDSDVASQLLKTNPEARQLYDNLTARRNADDMPRVWRYANEQRAEHEKAVDGAAFDLAIDNAATSLDPQVIEQNIATVGNIAVKHLLRTKEYDPNLIAQTRQTAVGKAVAAVAKRMEIKSPTEAQAFVTTHASMMDPQDAASLLDSLAPAVAQENADSDVRQFLVTPGGGAPAAPEGVPEAKAEPTPTPDDAALAAAQWAQESGGRHTDAHGNLISSGTSVGISQLKKSNIAPGSKGFGYGVVGPKDNSRAEYIRVGNDYRRALIKHYGGNVVLGLTAYNWGPGNVDAHIKAVGDPRKGQISDAAWINSIPEKEAREYAPKVLQRTGVNVSGATTQTQQKGYYGVSTGQEIDLPGTIDRINASDKTYIEKQALIAAASRLHTLGQQAKSDAEEALTDKVWTSVNALGDGFTDYTKLPLDLRQQLAATNPHLEAQFRNMAESNAAAEQAKLDKTTQEKADRTVEDLTELYYQNPRAFSTIDFRTQYPELNHTQRLSMMGEQQQYTKSLNGGTGPNIDAMRTTFSRYAGSAIKKDAGRQGFNFQEALRQEQAVLNEPGRNGKPLTDIERDAIVRRVLMPVVIRSTSGSKVVTRAEAPNTARALGTKFRGADASLREQARDAFILQNKRIPSDYELELAVSQWKKAHPQGYEYQGNR